MNYKEVMKNYKKVELNAIKDLDDDNPTKKEYLKEKTCCICGRSFTGFGNNPYPIYLNAEADHSNDICCDECNWNIVIPARIRISELHDNDNK